MYAQRAGLDAAVDVLGNVRATARGPPGAPALLTGSHYDTVVDGGKYDGAMGVVAGVAAVKAALATRAVELGLVRAADLEAAIDDATETEFDLRSFIAKHTPKETQETEPERASPDASPDASSPEASEPSSASGASPASVPALPRSLALPKVSATVLGFADEEGVRFQTTFLGSRAIAGRLVSSGVLDATDRDGARVRDVAGLASVGRALTDEDAAALALEPPFHSYVEVHMEQGPVLEAEGEPLAPVSGIAGQTRWAVRVRGEQGHAGTVPMPLRRDALAAAAEAVAELERVCLYGVGARPRALGPSGEDGATQTEVTEQLVELVVLEGDDEEIVQHEDQGEEQKQEEVAEGSSDETEEVSSSSSSSSPRVRALLRSGSSRAAPSSSSSSSPPFSSGRAGALYSVPLSTLDPSLVCTVGAFDPSPNAGNVIAGQVDFTVDVRSRDDAVRAAALEQFRGALVALCARRGVECEVEVKNVAAAVQSDERVVQGLVKAATNGVALLERIQQAEKESQGEATTSGSSRTCSAQDGTCASSSSPSSSSSSASSVSSPAVASRAPRLLVSGAGHDAMVMAEVAPMGMLFTRCRAGISHSPLEHVDPEDVAAGTAALFEYIVDAAW